MKWGRWLIGGALVAGVVGLVGFNLFKRQIGEAMFRAAAMETVGRDRAAELPDGLHVYLCGTGSPMPDPARAGPCIGIVAGEHVFVVDVGSGAPRKLTRMGFPVGRIDSVFLTHLHSDHIDGLGELMLQAWVGGSRSAPLVVAGPPGTGEVVAGFNQAYRIDSTYRTAHHGVSVANPAGFGAEAIELSAPVGGNAAVVFESGADLRVTAVNVDHSPVEPAYGFRIDYKGRSVAISGDTVHDARFVTLARNTDLMLHEALNPSMVQVMADAATAREQAALSQIMTDILDYHASPEDAALAAQEAGVSELVLYHIVPPLPMKLLNTAFLGDAGKIYDGRITVGEDGMMFSLLAGSEEIERQKIQ